MKSLTLLFAVAAIVAMVSTSAVTAQDSDQKKSDQPRQQAQDQDQPNESNQDQPWQDRRNSRRAGKLDSKTMGPMIRATALIGKGIESPRRKSVGEIQDVVLDARTGQISYVAVTYGGLLGFGDKLYAVPFKAFSFHKDPDDAENTILMLNVTQQQLEGAQGFSEQTWPNFADRRFTDQVDARYGVTRDETFTRNREGVNDEAVTEEDIAIPPKPPTEDKSGNDSGNANDNDSKDSGQDG